MKPKATLALVAVLVVLCLGYWLTQRAEERSIQKREEAKRLFTFAPEEIARMAIRHEDDEPTVGERGEDGAWAITAPYRVEANQVLWDRVAKQVAGLMKERVIEEKPGDLAAYELDDPRLTLSAMTRDGKEYRIIVGKAEPFQKSRYARVDDGPVILIPDAAHFEMNRELALLQEVYLFKPGKEPFSRLDFAWVRKLSGDDPDPADVRFSELKRGEESVRIVCELHEDGTWWMLEPDKGPADSPRLQELMAELQYVPGRNYVYEPESFEDYGLAPPRARITLSAGAGSTPETVFFGRLAGDDEESGGLFVKRAGANAVFQVDSHVVSLLPNEPGECLEKSLLVQGDRRIRRVRYASGEERFAIEADAKGVWRLVEPQAAEVDNSAVSQFLTALFNVKGEGYNDRPQPEFGLDEPRIEIGAAFEGDSGESVVRIGGPAAKSGQVYAQQARGSVTTITEQQAASLEMTLADLESKTLMRFSASRARRLALSFDGVSYVFEKGSRRWRIAEPAGKAWETQEDMFALLDTLDRVKATDIAADPIPQDMARFGLDAPILELRVSSAPESEGGPEVEAGPLTIGATSEENSRRRYATTGGRSELFLVDQSLIDGVRDALQGVVDGQEQP